MMRTSGFGVITTIAPSPGGPRGPPYAPLSETGRLRLARCVVTRVAAARAAERFQVSHTTAARWAPAPAGGAGVRPVVAAPVQPWPPPRLLSPDRGPAGVAAAGPGPDRVPAGPGPSTVPRCWPATAARGWRTWTGPPASRCAVRAGPARRAGPVTSRTGHIPTAAAGAPGQDAGSHTGPTATRPGAPPRPPTWATLPAHRPGRSLRLLHRDPATRQDTAAAFLARAAWSPPPGSPSNA